MLRKMTAMLLTMILLIVSLIVPAQAASWPASSDLDMSCWSQNDSTIKEDLGMFPDMTKVGSGLYMSPTVFISNTTSSRKSFSMYWKVDGIREEFGNVSVNAGDKGIWALDASHAAKYVKDGLHIVEVFVDGNSVYTYMYWLSGSGSASSGSSSSSSSSGSRSSSGSDSSSGSSSGSSWGSGSTRSTVPNFNAHGYTSKNFTVSGLVWREKRGGSNAGPKTNKNATAAGAESIIASGGSFAINYKMTPKGIKGDVTLSVKLVIVSPDGYEGTLNFGYCTFYRGYYLYSDFAGDGYFANYYRDRGHIASGNYQLFLYLDDQLANYSTLNLR